jgi:hypothetical protein
MQCHAMLPAAIRAAHGTHVLPATTLRARMQVLGDAPDETSAAAAGSLSDKVKSAGFIQSSANQSQYARASDYFGAKGSVAAIDLVNVFGRWSSYAEWDSIGPLEEMNQLFDAEGEILDGPALQRAWARYEAAYEAAFANGALEKKSDEFKRTKLPTWVQTSGGKRTRDPAWGEALNGLGTDPTACQSPQRRQFCLKQGQVQRYWHSTNVLLLPFTSEALAASVGLTAAEMNQRPVNPLACDVVFDALSRSQSGITDKTLIDSRRAAYQAADGTFDVDGFASDLGLARKNCLVATAIWPGVPFAIFTLLFFQVDGVEQAAEYSRAFLGPLAELYGFA